MPDTGYVIRSASAEINALMREIESNIHYAQRALESAQQSLDNCQRLIIPTNDGQESVDCTPEMERVFLCQDELMRLDRLRDQLSNAASRFSNAISVLERLEARDLPAAKQYLQRRVTAIEKFESSSPLPPAASASPLHLNDSIRLNSRDSGAAQSAFQPKHVTGDIGEKLLISALRKLDNVRAGGGLHMHRQGIDVYRIVNTPRGKSLHVYEVKATGKPNVYPHTGSIQRLLKTSKDGLQQGSRNYTQNRIRKAAQQGNKAALHVRSLMTHGKIKRVANYTAYVNIATRDIRVFRNTSNAAGNRVIKLRLERRHLDKLK